MTLNEVTRIFMEETEFAFRQMKGAVMEAPATSLAAIAIPVRDLDRDASVFIAVTSHETKGLDLEGVRKLAASKAADALRAFEKARKEMVA